MSKFDSHRLNLRGANGAVSIALLLTALALHGVAFSQTNKCVGKDGRTTYSATPCGQGEQAQTLAIPATAPPPAPSTKGDVDAARQREKQAFEAHEAKRQKALARERESDARARQVQATADRVRQIKAENYDPAKCAAARGKAASIQRRDPLMAPSNIDYFEMKQKAELYCGP
jgi:type IV secretory pathway VirB10-like protein